MQCFGECTTSMSIQISDLLLVVSSPTMTVTEKTTDTTLETEMTKMIHQVEKPI